MNNLDDALDVVGLSIVDELKKLAKRDGFRTTGNLINSFSYKREGNTVNIYGAKYTRAVSDGIKDRKGGDKSSFLEKKSNIKQWLKDKNIPIYGYKGRFIPRTEYNINNVAYLISKNIKNKGISKRFGYSGSGFFEEMEKNTISKVSKLIADAYKLDIIVKLEEI